MKREKQKPKYVEKKQPPQGQSPELPPPKRKTYLQKQQSIYSQEQSCLVCSQPMKVRQAIWSCKCCYKFMHLACIKKWIYNCNKAEKKSDLYNWSCPQCKFEYRDKLPEYYCFCGKFKNPDFDREVTPHSCGKYCQKRRGFYCPHPCPQLCHPGKCQPCTQEGIEIPCSCGKSKMTIKCSDQKESFQCEKKCQKLLNCGKHNCKKNCHAGPCTACTYKHMATCYCGKNQDVIGCTESSYKCGAICGKKLDCGNHTCQQKCHEGPCNSCFNKSQLVNKCPCGQYTLMMLTGSDNFRTSCTDPIPVCGMPCKKPLKCSHLCSKSCHEGDCSKCKVQVIQRCVCGISTRRAQCWQLQQQFKCEKICKHKKSCNQHSCNIVCCPFRQSQVSSDHPCMLICQRMLNCNKHTCGLGCHSGNCDKCAVLYSQPQPCPCGRTFLRAPVSCGTVVPECDNGCDKVLECGHICKSKCHYGVCRCSQKVFMKCQCGRNMIQTQCGKSVLCTERCKNILSCGHTCNIQCHNGECVYNNKEQGCPSICNKKRDNCDHLCMQKCHPNRACTEVACSAQVLIKCECGNRQKMVACGSTERLIEKHITCNKTCQNLKRFSILYKQKDIYYPNSLIIFGMRNFKYLQKLEQSVEQFIKSQRLSLHVNFKFSGDNNIKIAMHTLFEKHYHLEAYFYPNKKMPFFTLSQTKHTMIPEPNLSKYIIMVKQGDIKKNSPPFQASLKFGVLPKQKVDLLEQFLKEFIHNYYSERKDKNHYIHFWIKQDAEEASVLLKDKYPGGFAFTLEIYIVEQKVPEVIDISEIIEEQIEKKDRTEQIIEQKQKQTNPSVITQQKQKQTIKAQPLIIKKSQFLNKNKIYPPSENFVQNVYSLDDDELDQTQVNWDQYVQKINQQQLGMEASQWRVRILIMTNSLFHTSRNILIEQLQKLIKWYESEKNRARRILAIRNIQAKKILEFLNQNEVFISQHEPEFIGYFILTCSDTQVEISKELLQTRQVIFAYQILDAIKKENYQLYFESLKNCDYMMSCILLYYLESMRKIALRMIQKRKKKFSIIQLSEYLFFDEVEQFKSYLEENSYKIEKKKPKNKSVDDSEEQQDTDQQIYFLNKSETALESKSVVELRFNHSKLLKEKRDVKYVLNPPKQVLEQCYCLRSYYAFGDHKEQESAYISKLAKSFKKK